MYVGWDESELSDSDSENEAQVAFQDPNICFMALGEEVQSESESDSPSSYDELKDALIEVTTKYKRLAKKFFVLSNLHDSCDTKYNDLLASMNDTISLRDKHIIDLEHEIKRLDEEVIQLASSSNNVISSKNTIIQTLEKEKRYFCYQIKVLKNTSFCFPRTNAFHGDSSTSHHSHTHAHSHVRSHTPSHKKTFICTYCMRQGHISTYCRVKKNLSFSSFTWVPKGTKSSNSYGPKFWVLKVSSSSLTIGSHSNKT